ncbi:MAG: hypothetical protein Q7T10_01150 [Rhodoferax sp.]|nr:hypothetical protein [Rhodoferax sp.]
MPGIVWPSPATGLFAKPAVRGYRSGMKKQSFWNVDLLELFRLWISDMGTFLMTTLMFVGLSMPVVIPALILWYLLSINWSMSP